MLRPLDNPLDSFLQAPRKRSMSAFSVFQPRLTRTAPRRSGAETPMAPSTWDGCTLPDEQAAPEETATPSRSKAMTAVSAFMPSTENKEVLGNLSTASPKIAAFGDIDLRLLSNLSRNSFT